MMKETKISYETNGKESKIEINGTGEGLLKGISRLAHHVRTQMNIEFDEFVNMLKGGMKIAELEFKVSNDEEINDDDLSELLDEMLELINND